MFYEFIFNQSLKVKIISKVFVNDLSGDYDPNSHQAIQK